MICRTFWLERIKQSWEQAPIAWLCGVRRSGKTTLAAELGDRAYFVNCDLPVAEEMVRDPQLFFRSVNKPIVVFDEIHQLNDPSRVLKIGADLFPGIKILATGSSTLAASHKFLDTLTGRKRTIHLLPVLWRELEAFNQTPAIRRLYHGGLPQALLAEKKHPAFYREWMDSFFARDIQRLFAFRDINRFNSLLEYLMRQSGGQLEITKTATALGITRPTVESHIQALEITKALTVVRPFHGSGRAELVKMPKLYLFDTGFVSFVRGWDPLRPDDYGILWEHLVLEQLQAEFPDLAVRYWRDKQGREVDFVLAQGRDACDVIECKWNAADFDPGNLRAFRSLYPNGKNYVVSPSAEPAYARRFGEMEVKVCTPAGILNAG